MRRRVVLLAGTRPEAVKIAPVALALLDHPELSPVIVHSGQHPDMVGEALAPFGLSADVELAVDRATGSQAELVSAMLPILDETIQQVRPAVMLVQGDTSSALVGALAAFWRGVALAHLEAGLRTDNLELPFPEEAHRQLIARISALHLAPTPAAADALRRERLAHPRIVVTGNTVVDAVTHIARADLPPRSAELAEFEQSVRAGGGRLMLVTAHRRESWGQPLAQVLSAVRDIVDQWPDLFVLLPTHPNPVVANQARAALGGHPRVGITPPLDYPDLVRALRLASLVITDSGGIQEEAPTFGVPVLVAREVTERMEAVQVGLAMLVGTDRNRIVTEANRVLRLKLRFSPDRNPYGDGKAALRVVDELERLLQPVVATTSRDELAHTPAS